MTQAKHELSISQQIAASPATVWRVITEQLPEWWCPKPWRTQVDAIEWRAGGAFNTTMFGPEGEEIPGEGVFLEVTPGKRMVFTDALNSDWQPQEAFMVGMIEITADKGGTCYTASARHWSEDTLKQHENMGFREGWQTVAQQLAALAEAQEMKTA